jgi:hypothetical protein
MARGHFEDQSLDGRIILKWFFKTWDGSLDWIYLAQDWNEWRAVVNKVMNV